MSKNPTGGASTYRPYTVKEANEMVDWLTRLSSPHYDRAKTRETVDYILFDATQRLSRHQHHPEVQIGPEAVQNILRVVEKAREVLAYLNTL